MRLHHLLLPLVLASVPVACGAEEDRRTKPYELESYFREDAQARTDAANRARGYALQGLERDKGCSTQVPSPLSDEDKARLARCKSEYDQLNLRMSEANTVASKALLRFLGGISELEKHCERPSKAATLDQAIAELVVSSPGGSPTDAEAGRERVRQDLSYRRLSVNCTAVEGRHDKVIASAVAGASRMKGLKEEADRVR